MSSHRQVLSYLWVGGAGFLVDATLTQAFVSLLGLDPYVARFPAFAVAATATWLLNRRHTFRAEHKHGFGLAVEWLSYLAANAFGMFLNYAVYGSLVAASDFFRASPFAAVAAGSAVAMVVNFVINKHVVFKKRRDA